MTTQLEVDRLMRQSPFERAKLCSGGGMRSILIFAALCGVFGSAACNTVSGAAGPLPPSSIGEANGNVVLLPRLITELKCDYREWERHREPGHDRLTISGVRGLLTLSLIRDNTEGHGADLAIPVAATGLVLKPSLATSTESKVTTKVVIPFEMFRDPQTRTTLGDDTLDCSPNKRLPQPILAMEALGEGLEQSPAGSPYFQFDREDDAKDLNFSGQFYLLKQGSGGFSIEFLTSKANLASLGKMQLTSKTTTSM